MRRVALLLAGLAALAAPAPRADVTVDYYDARGRAVRSETLYPAHRALYVATETGRAAARPARREAALAWLETLGMDVEAIGPGGDAPLVERALAWAREAADEPDAGLLVIVDSALRQGPSGLSLARAAGAQAAPFEVRRLMEALDATPARHVLVVFTDTIGVTAVDWGRPAGGLPPGAPGWLTAEAGSLARQAIVPWSADLGVLGLLGAALSQDPALAAGRPGAFDPDAFLTARDLAGLSPGLALWRFGARDAGGDFVLARRAVPETRFDGRETPREGYAAIRFDEEPARLEAFLSGGGESRWHRAAALQLRRQETRRRRAAGAACDAALDFAAEELMGLNAGVLGRLDAAASARELAAAWLEAIRAASGIGPMEREQARARCAGAETRPDFAPGRALRLAVLGRDGADAFALAAAAAGDWPGRGAAAALAGLHLIAHGPPPGGPGPVLAALDRAAGAGDGAARLVRALTLIDGVYRAAAPARAEADLEAAAGAGVALADALRAALALSPHPLFAGWRSGLAPDREAAFAALERARGAGIAVAPTVLDMAALGRARLAACERATAAIDPAAALSARGAPGLAAFERLMNAPAEALAPLRRRVSADAVARSCARLPERADLSPSEAERRDDLALRLALLEIAGGEAGAASARLAAVPEPSGDALLAAALAAPGAERGRRLAAAADAGQPLAEAAVALIAAGQGRAEGAARLRALGDGGMALANALLAGLRLSEAAAAGPAAAEADRALLEGVLRVEAARAGGVGISLGPEEIARLSTRAAWILGLRLAAAGEAQRALLGPTLPEGGAVVIEAAGGALAPGDVIRAVGGRPVSTLAETERALFAGLYGAALGGGPVTLEVAALGSGGARRVTLALPAALDGLAVPAALR